MTHPLTRSPKRSQTSPSASPRPALARYTHPPRCRPSARPLLALGLVIAALLTAPAQAATPAELLAGYTAEAGAAASAERGQRFFNTAQGREWSCASCHGKLPVGAGRHAGTGKPIAALAPAANPERFSDSAKAEKWFRRNCNDVAARACTAGEKADVLAWLMTLEP